MDFQQLPTLTEEQRHAVWVECMKDISTKHLVTNLSKAEWREAVDVVDDWITANMAVVDAELPENIRQGLTMQQKAIVFFKVVSAKIGGF